MFQGGGARTPSKRGFSLQASLGLLSPAKEKRSTLCEFSNHIPMMNVEVRLHLFTVTLLLFLEVCSLVDA